MEKMWAGRFAKELNTAANDFNSSIRVDCVMYREDILGSIAHAEMLMRQGIITGADGTAIIDGLTGILADFENGSLSADPAAEDIHMFIEGVLTARIGEAGKRLHTARSRNDQVAVDTKMYTRSALGNIAKELCGVISVLLSVAEKNTDSFLAGYTHLQRAQPVSLGHYMLAYCAMFMRDVTRVEDTLSRMNECPLGSAALAGTTYPIDREYTATKLGFDAPMMNSIDGVSDRDYVLESMSDIATIMMHLSRLSEELILWSTVEFKYVELSDEYSTGSSIMPQKKNPDILELIRGKTGRTYGNLMGLLCTMKGLPLAYNKDMQEDKEALFDSIDTVTTCLSLMGQVIATAVFRTDNMLSSADRGYINATDCADYLVAHGLPFRTAYKITGQLVAHAVASGKSLSELTLDEYHLYSPLFEQDIYQTIAIASCVKRRNSAGGPGAESVNAQLNTVRAFLATHD